MRVLDALVPPNFSFFQLSSFETGLDKNTQTILVQLQGRGVVGTGMWLRTGSGTGMGTGVFWWEWGQGWWWAGVQEGVR